MPKKAKRANCPSCKSLVTLGPDGALRVHNAFDKKGVPLGRCSMSSKVPDSFRPVESSLPPQAVKQLKVGRCSVCKKPINVEGRFLTPHLGHDSEWCSGSGKKPIRPGGGPRADKPQPRTVSGGLPGLGKRR